MSRQQQPPDIMQLLSLMMGGLQPGVAATLIPDGRGGFRMTDTSQMMQPGGIQRWEVETYGELAAFTHRCERASECGAAVRDPRFPEILKRMGHEMVDIMTTRIGLADDGPSLLSCRILGAVGDHAATAGWARVLAEPSIYQGLGLLGTPMSDPAASHYVRDATESGGFLKGSENYELQMTRHVSAEGFLKILKAMNAARARAGPAGGAFPKDVADALSTAGAQLVQRIEKKFNGPYPIYMHVDTQKLFLEIGRLLMRQPELSGACAVPETALANSKVQRPLGWKRDNFGR